MNNKTNQRVVSALDWLEICPWLRLVSAIQIGFSFRLSLLVLAHLLFSAWLCWSFCGFVPKEQNFSSFLERHSVVQREESFSAQVFRYFFPASSSEWSELEEVVSNDAPNDALLLDCLPLEENAASEVGSAAKNPEPESSCRFLSDVYEVLSQLSWVSWLVFAWIFFASLFLWMMIARLTAIRVATGVRARVWSESRLVCRKMVSFGAALFYMVVGIAILLLPLWLTCFLPESAIAFVAPFAILLNWLVFFVVIGALVGSWLLLCALVAENSDCFDALSRAYAYTWQRPLRFLFYILVAVGFFYFGDSAISIFAMLSVDLLRLAMQRNLPIFEAQSEWLWFWSFAFGWLPLAFRFIFFASASAVIYMLLRRDVDAVEMDEVWLEKPQGPPIPKLPRLQAQPQDAPAE
ncbi:MAG: hypothetical protein Q4D38_02840 [Planctomycetia bacterium]|nr:hypothetical protein [Planctomycetia bacterium]